MALIRDDGSLVPQHWRDGQWRITGDNNPLPVENYIFNGSVWVPVSDTNPLPTKTTNTVNIQTQETLDVTVQNASIPVDVQNTTLPVTAPSALPVNVQNANLSVSASGTLPVNVQNSSIPVTASSALPVSVQNSSIPVNVQNSSVTVTATSDLPTKLQGRSSHKSIETNATTTETNMSFDVDFIVLIANDGTDIVKFNFDANTSSAGTITLKAGEVLTDFPRKCTTIYFKANSGTQPIRIWGVK